MSTEVATAQPTEDELFNQLTNKVESKVAESVLEKTNTEIAELRKEIALLRKSPPNFAQPKEVKKAPFGRWLQLTKTYQSKFTAPDDKVAAWAELEDKFQQSGLQKTIQNQTGGSPAGSQGGFLVPPEFSDGILRMQNLQSVIFRPDGRSAAQADGSQGTMGADVVEMRSNIEYWPVLDMSSTPSSGSSAFAGGLTTGYVAEGNAPGSTVISNWKQLKVQADKEMALVEVTNELLQNNTYNAEKVISDVLTEETISKFDYWCFNGNSNNVQGILQSSGLISVNRTTGSHVTLADLAHMRGHIHPRYKSGYFWVMQPMTFSELLQISSSNGQLVMLPGHVINGQPVYAAFGHPIIESDNVPGLGTSADVCLINPKLGYTLGVNRGIEIALSEHYGFNLDVTTFRITLRAGGSVNYAYPILLKDGVSTVSPFIALGAQGSSF